MYICINVYIYIYIERERETYNIYTYRTLGKGTVQKVWTRYISIRFKTMLLSTCALARGWVTACDARGLSSPNNDNYDY